MTACLSRGCPWTWTMLHGIWMSRYSGNGQRMIVLDGITRQLVNDF